MDGVELLCLCEVRVGRVCVCGILGLVWVYRWDCVGVGEGVEGSGGCCCMGFGW